MTQPPPPSTPPFGDDIDEALSAFLDGELAAFAEARGFTEASARAQLDAWPDLEQRLEVLERNRAAMQAPVPPLDEVTRRRLVRNALDELPAAPHASKPSRPWAAIAAVAAAALIAVAGIGVAISSTGGGGDGASSAGSKADSIAGDRLRGDVGDLGDVTSPQALRTLLDRSAVAGAAGAGSDRAAQGAPAASSTLPSPPFAQTSPTTPEAADSSRRAASVAACARQVAGNRAVTFTGTGEYQGQSVTIVGISKDGRTIVFVVAATDCTKVLASISR